MVYNENQALGSLLLPLCVVDVEKRSESVKSPKPAGCFIKSGLDYYCCVWASLGSNDHRIFPAAVLWCRGAQFVIADFDREGVIDDKVFASMRSGDYWKRNPKANRLFLVLDNISAP